MQANFKTTACALLPLLLWSSDAIAQRAASSPEETPPTTDHIVLGAGIAYAPAYQGAEDYRAFPLPLIDVQRGDVFINMRDGVGLNLVDVGKFKLAASVAPMPGYRARDAPTGVGRLSVGAGARLSVNVDLGGLVASAGATHGLIGSTGGVIADANLTLPIPLSPRLLIAPSIGLSWADARHQQRYFGISASQAAASLLPRFRPGAGFKDATLGMAAHYRLDARLNLTVSGGVTRLFSSVRESPLVAHVTRPWLSAGLSYRM